MRHIMGMLFLSVATNAFATVPLLNNSDLSRGLEGYTVVGQSGDKGGGVYAKVGGGVLVSTCMGNNSFAAFHQEIQDVRPGQFLRARALVCSTTKAGQMLFTEFRWGTNDTIKRMTRRCTSNFNEWEELDDVFEVKTTPVYINLGIMGESGQMLVGSIRIEEISKKEFESYKKADKPVSEMRALTGGAWRRLWQSEAPATQLPESLRKGVAELNAKAKKLLVPEPTEREKALTAILAEQDRINLLSEGKLNPTEVAAKDKTINLAVVNVYERHPLYVRCECSDPDARFFQVLKSADNKPLRFELDDGNIVVAPQNEPVEIVVELSHPPTTGGTIRLLALDHTSSDAWRVVKIMPSSKEFPQ